MCNAPGNLESNLVKTVRRRERWSLEQSTGCQCQGGVGVAVARISTLFLSFVLLLCPPKVMQAEEVHRHSAREFQINSSNYKHTLKKCQVVDGQAYNEQSVILWGFCVSHSHFLKAMQQRPRGTWYTGLFRISSTLDAFVKCLHHYN